VVVAVFALPAVIVAAILAANASGRSTPRLVGQVPGAPASSVTVRLDVPRATVDRGQPVEATVYVFNHTDASLRVNCSSSTWPLLMLSGGGLPAQGFDPLLPCPATVLPPGASHFSVSVPTTYRQCGSSAAGRTTDDPECGPGPSMPPLPGGIYQLRMIPDGLPPGSSLPAPVAITLR
jgi:hypothetical protein